VRAALKTETTEHSYEHSNTKKEKTNEFTLNNPFQPIKIVFSGDVVAIKLQGIAIIRA